MNDNLVAYGEKIRLESMKLQDIDAMMHWGEHEEDLFRDYDFPYMSEQERVHWFRFKTKGKKRCFSVFNREGDLVGYISLRNVNRVLRRCEMGIVFDPSLLSKGYGTDAMRTLLQWYFKELKYRKLVLNVAAYNKRALRAYQKVGFQKISQYYAEFLNPAINPLQDERYLEIRRYFRKRWEKIEVLHYKMEISTLSTG